MSWSRRAALGFLVAALGGCGLRPLYGRGSGGQVTVAALGAVAIGPIPGRLGQVLHNDLRDRINPQGAPGRPRYRLEVQVFRFKEGLAIKKDEEITRSNLRLTATFVLSDYRSGERLLEGSARSTGSFNLVRSDFANLVAERDAERRVAREISEQILTRLSLYFDRQSQG